MRKPPSPEETVARGRFWLHVGLHFCFCMVAVLMTAATTTEQSASLNALFETLIVMSLLGCVGCCFAVLQIGEGVYLRFLKRVFFVR